MPKVVSGVTQKSLAKVDLNKQSLLTAQQLILSEKSLSAITSLHSSHNTCSVSTSSVTEVITLDNVTTDHCDHSSRTEQPWTKCGGISLSMKDLQQITGGRELTDKHVNAYQNIMKSHFPHLHVGGIQSTLFQLKSPLSLQSQTSLKIIHTRKSHWSCLEVCGTDIRLYDSSYSSCSADTLEVVAQLVRSNNPSIEVHVMNVAKQSGSSDCALFAMGTITCLALDIDPLRVVYDQEQLS